MALLDKLKAECINQLETLNLFICEIDSDIFDVIDTQLFAKIEEIRENYNKLILNNQKTILSSEILIDLKEKFIKMKKVLNEGSEEEEPSTPSSFNSSSFYYTKKSKYDPNANVNTSTRKDNTNSKLGYKKYISNQNSKFKSNNENFNNDNAINQYDLSNTDRPKKKQVNQKNISHGTSIEKNINRNKIDNETNGSSYDNKSSQIIQLKTEMMILKEDMKRLLNNKIDSKSNDDQVVRLSDENYKMKNDIFDLRKEVDDLKNIISSMNKKMKEIMDDNQSLKRHNQSLINYISTLTSNQYSRDPICNNNNANYNYPSNTGYYNYQDSNNKNNLNRKGDLMDELSKEYISDDINEGEMTQ